MYKYGKIEFSPLTSLFAARKFILLDLPSGENLEGLIMKQPKLKDLKLNRKETLAMREAMAN